MAVYFHTGTPVMPSQNTFILVYPQYTLPPPLPLSSNPSIAIVFQSPHLFSFNMSMLRATRIASIDLPLIFSQRHAPVHPSVSSLPLYVPQFRTFGVLANARKYQLNRTQLYHSPRCWIPNAYAATSPTSGRKKPSPSRCALHNVCPSMFHHRPTSDHPHAL
jgi:hypothetical protein